MIKMAQNEEVIFNWFHNEDAHARLGIISKEKHSKVIAGLKKIFKERNEVSYHITTEKPKCDGGIQDTLSILQFEEHPSLEGDSQFAADRMKWVQMYFSLLSVIHDRERTEFIPLASFRSHAEGPLMGYIRAIQELEEGTTKGILETHLRKLEAVQWTVSEENGFVFYVEGESDEELLESLFIGAWALWLYTAFIEDNRPINLFVELYGMLLSFPVKGEKRDFITFIVGSLARLTFQLNMSLIVKSTTLFPLPESIVEHLIIETADTLDIDWQSNTDFPKFIEGMEIVWEHQQIFRKMKLALAD